MSTICLYCRHPSGDQTRCSYCGAPAALREPEPLVRSCGISGCLDNQPTLTVAEMIAANEDHFRRAALQPR